MAYFKLELLTLNSQEGDDLNVSYLASTMSEFYTQRDEYLSNKNTDFQTSIDDFGVSSLEKKGTVDPNNDNDDYGYDHFHTQGNKEGQLNTATPEDKDFLSLAPEELMGEADFNTNYLASRKNTFCYTENEKISFHQNSQIEFSFDINEKIFYKTEWITNPFIHNLAPGTPLLLTDKDGNEHLLSIKQVQINFKNNNTVYSVTCQDSFSYQGARQHRGYEIKNDSSSEDFIGAKTLDWWANKIVTDCNIVYEYIPMQAGLYLSKRGKYKSFTSSGNKYEVQNTIDGKTVNTELTDAKEIIKIPYTPTLYPDYFEAFPFSASGSTATAALISAAEELDMNLVVFEKSFVKQNQLFFIRQFWFEPKKNPDRISGLTYSPSASVQSFNLSFAGENLTTILDVDGTTRSNDELVTLLPEISPFFVSLFNSSDWDNSTYYKGYFSDICKGHLFKINKESNLTLGKSSSTTINGTEYLLIPINGWKGLFTNLYNKVSFSYLNQNNKDTHTYLSSLAFKNAAGETVTSFAPLSDWRFCVYYNTTCELFAASEEIPSDVLKLIKEGNQGVYLYIAIESEKSSFLPTNDYDIYLYFFRNYTDEDLEFAEIADECPWLENKLINLDYFLKHNIISSSQLSNISSILNDDLRKVNGRLLLYSNEYYAAVHSKTKIIAELTNQLDELGAAAQADLIDPFARLGSIQDSKFFESSYNTTFKTIGGEKMPLVGYNDLITFYGNKYFNARQSFLKNVYNFKNFFNAPNLRYANSNVEVGSLKVETDYPGFATVNNDSIPVPGKYNWISFKEADFMPEVVSSSFPFAMDNGYTSVPVFSRNIDNKSYSLMKLVNAGNLSDFYEVKSYLTGVDPIPSGTKVVYNSAQTYWTVDDEGNKTILPLGPFINRDMPSIADRYNLSTTNNFTKKIYQRDTTKNYSSAFEKWPKFFTSLVITNDKTWESGNDYSSSYFWKLFSYTLMQDYAKEDNDYTKRLAKVTGSTGNFKEAFNTVFKNTQDKDQRYSAELYAANLPVSSLYIKEDDTYKETPYVTPSNEMQYYRYVTGLNKFTYWNAEHKALSVLFWTLAGAGGGLIAGHIIARESYKAWDRQVKNSTFDTTGYSSVDLTSTRYLINYYEGWSLDQSTPWYVKDPDAMDTLVKANSSNLNYNNFYSLMAPTYSYITSMPTIPAQRAEGVSDSFKSTLYSAAFNSRKKYYYKDSWIRPIMLTDRVNRSDKYYICVLGSDINTETSAEDIILNGGIINPLTAADGITQLQNWFNPTNAGIDSTCEHYNPDSKLTVKVPRLSKVVFYPLINVMTSTTFNFDNVNVKSKTLKDALTSKDKYQTMSNLKCVWSATSLSDHMDTKNYVFEAILENAIVDEEGNLTGNTQKIKTVFMIFHDEPYTPIYNDNVTAENYYTSYKQIPFYYVEDDSTVDYATISDALVGLYTKKENNFQHDADIKRITTFNPNGDYYSVENEVVKKAYTIQNLMNGQAIAYYRKDISYTTPCIFGDEFIISIPITFNQTTVSDDSQITTTTNKGDIKTVTDSSSQNIQIKVSYDSKGQMKFTDLLTKETSVDNQLVLTRTKNDIVYKSVLRISKDDNSESVSLGNLSNGAFWNLFHDKDNSVLGPLVENAAVIETQLEEYWTQAYTASKYCEYFLPEHWQPRNNKTTNYFSQSIYSTNGNTATLSDKYLPNVKMVTNNNCSSVQNYNFEYYSDITDHLKTPINSLILDYDNSENESNYALSSNAAISQFANILYDLQGNFTEHWVLTKNGTKSFYYTEEDGSGTTWVQMLQDLSSNSVNFNKFSGLYVMMLNILCNNYFDNPLPLYNHLITQHNSLWNDLYLKYPGLMLEDTYSNADATNSRELFAAASNYLKKMSQPEHNYSIATIDINAIKGYHGQALKIGDPIEINASEYHNEPDEIREALSQYLFVSDISYTLRKDDNIQLTVNDIKYQDKLIKSLAKLIR